MRTEPPTGDELTRLLESMKRNVLEQVAHEQVSTKRSPLADRVTGLVLGVALLLGLGAGAAFALGVVPPLGAPTPASAPTSTSTPTTPPVEYAVAPGQPASRYGLECETLIDSTLVSDLFTTAVAPADPIVTAAGVGITIPRRTSILSVGGTVCEWSNGVAMNTQYTLEPEYVGVTVSIVPRPADGWSEQATHYGMPGDESRCGDGGCWASTAVGDAWVAVEAFGGEPSALDPSGWQPLLDAIIEAVSAAGPAAAPSSPEQTSLPSPERCEAVIPLDVLRSITSTPDAEPRLLGAGGWSEWGEARLHADNVGCAWSVEDDYVAVVDWVGDGRWAYERMLHAGTASPLELAGLDSGDVAFIRCNESFNSNCAVDLAVGRDWYNVGATDRDTAIALAEAALAQLAP
jgi:hypothetical protein